jgi:hypothetical protein
LTDGGTFSTVLAGAGAANIAVGATNIISATSTGAAVTGSLSVSASGTAISAPNGTAALGALSAGGIVKAAPTSGLLSIASVGDINSGMGYSVPVTGDGVYTIANGSRLNGIFHIHWEASNRAEDLVVQCNASQFGNATITVLSYNSYSANNSISNVSIYQASGGATVYLTVTLGNRNSGTNSIGVTYFGGSAGMGFLGSYSGAAIASVTTVPNNSLATSNNAVIGGSLTANATGTAISAPNGGISYNGPEIILDKIIIGGASYTLSAPYAFVAFIGTGTAVSMPAGSTDGQMMILSNSGTANILINNRVLSAFSLQTGTSRTMQWYAAGSEWF